MDRQSVKNNRGFELVKSTARTAYDVFTDEKGGKHRFEKEITLPTRADPTSAGYDFYIPKDIKIMPNQRVVVFTDVKAYMQPDEVLKMYIRSSKATKDGLMLTLNVGIIDASYYGNDDNDGNIGIPLVNTTGTTVELKAGERVAQGIFVKYLTTDNDECLADTRVGGYGSSGK